MQRKTKIFWEKEKKKCEGKKAPLWNDTAAFRTNDTAFVQIQALIFLFFLREWLCSQ